MAKWALGILIVLLVAGIGAYSAGFLNFHAGVNATTCLEDGEIPEATRAALDNRAIAFTNAVLSQDLDLARGMMTEAARGPVTADRFSALFGTMIRTAGPFAAPAAAHTYFVRSAGSGPDARVLCGTLTNNQWASVEIRPGVEQGHVVVAVQSRNNEWAFSYWLLPDKNDWQVQYVHMGVSSIVGLSAGQMLERARVERDGGRAFNATLLYAAARGLADYGVALQPGIARPIREDLQKFNPAPELAGHPPFEWTMSGTTYTVAQAALLGVNKKLGIVFMLPQKEWAGNDEADRFNRAFLSAFVTSHPDYSRSFAFLVARALKPDNSGGFGTVYENGKGFD
jgi:hypothetical protein